MRSLCSPLNPQYCSRPRLLRSPNQKSFIRFNSQFRRRSGGSDSYYYAPKLNELNVRNRGFSFRHGVTRVGTDFGDSFDDVSSIEDWHDENGVSHSHYAPNLDELKVWKHGHSFQHGVTRDSFDDVSSIHDWHDENEDADYILSSSDSEDSDADVEIVMHPVSDLDLPTTRTRVSNYEALTMAAHRLGMIGRTHRKHRIYLGVLLNLGLVIFSTVLLVIVDCCGWKIVRLPLAPFYLTRPFLLSAILTSCAGYICVPWLKDLRSYQIITQGKPIRNSRKKRTPTMGGLFLVPVGIFVAKALAGSSVDLSGVAIATISFAAIGLSDDVVSLINVDNVGLSPWLRLLLKAFVGIWFSFWLGATSLPSPYGMYIFLF